MLEKPYSFFRRLIKYVTEKTNLQNGKPGKSFRIKNTSVVHMPWNSIC